MFVDTSGIYCLYNRDQNDHKAAIDFYYSAHRRVTTNYVLAEYVALADKRGSSHKDAIDFSQQILDDEEIELIWVDENLHRRAVQLLLERKDKTYSLCDAVSFLIMKRQNLLEALTTDEHFDQEGLVRLLKE